MNPDTAKSAGLKIIPLGGLGEIGMNMTVFEYGDDIIVVDCGLMFPESYMLGIDIVIPDISYLWENRDKIRGILFTHGHEDHIGALPFVLRKITPPLFGTALTLGFIREKLKEFELENSVDYGVVKPRDVIRLGAFEVEFIRVTHSIVDGCGLAIRSPEGVVIHTGDFKLDQTPVDGELTDLATFARYGEEGVLALMADSTNIESSGFTLSEKYVGEAFDEIFPKCPGRIMVAAFSSNIHRVQQVVNTAVRQGRKVLLNGRSMIANVQIARELGYLKIPDGLLVDLREMNRLAPQEVCMITTGSQGEPMSALSRIAMDDHKQIKLGPGDTVILSSKFIPGNERTISELINNLYRIGVEVYYEKVSEVHVSGHASRQELKMMHNLVRPRWFIPIHGEYRHLVRHRSLAMRVGMSPEHCILVGKRRRRHLQQRHGGDHRQGGDRPGLRGRQGGRRRRQHRPQGPEAHVRRRHGGGHHRHQPGVRRDHLRPRHHLPRLRLRGREPGVPGRGEESGARHPGGSQHLGHGRLERGEAGGPPHPPPLLQQDHRTAAGDSADDYRNVELTGTGDSGTREAC